MENLFSIRLSVSILKDYNKIEEIEKDLKEFQLELIKKHFGKNN